MNRELITSFNGRIQLFRNLSATTITDASLVLAGEIAVGDGVLFIKNANGEIATFSNDEKLLSLNEVIGTSSSGQSRDRFYYEDASGNVSARLNSMALKVGNAMPSIDTNFKVEIVEFEDNGATMTQPMFLYNIDCPVNVVYVKKVSGDTETIIYSGETQAYSGAVTVENIEEEYVLEFTPSELPNVTIKEAIHTYVCCLTSTSASTLNSNTVAQLNYLLTSDKNVTGEVHTDNGEYIYALIPSTVGLKDVKSQNIGVKLSDTTNTLVSNIGNFVCYRTLNALGENNWKLKIDLTDIKGESRVVTSSEKPTYLDYWKITGDSQIVNIPYPDDIVLPSGYQLCEYLETTDGAYIELPFGFDNTDEVHAKVSMLQLYNTDKYFVSPKTWNNNNNRFAMGIHKSGGTACFSTGYGQVSTDNTALSPLINPDSVTRIWQYKNYKFTLDNIAEKDVSDITFGGTTANLRLFFGYNSATKSRIYEYRHKKTNAEYRLVACLDNNDVPCMYDVINGQAYYNVAGKGSFSYNLYPTQVLLSCGKYSAEDNKYHISVHPFGKTTVDVALGEPLRKMGDAADTLEYPSTVEGKAIWTKKVVEANGELSVLTNPRVQLVDVPKIVSSTSYRLDKAPWDATISWSKFETE